MYVCTIYKYLLLTEGVGFSFQINTLTLRKAGYTRNHIKGRKKKKKKWKPLYFVIQ